MKRFLTLLLVLVAGTAAAQLVDVSAVDGAPYRCYVDGVLQDGGHNQDRTATQRVQALQWEHPESDVECVRTTVLRGVINALGRALIEDADAGVVVTQPVPSGDPVVDLSQLTTYDGEAVADENRAAYDLIDVPSQAAGFSWFDPATGVRTTKITASGTPSTSSHVSIYSTMGRPISRCWDSDADQECDTYTLWYHAPQTGSAYFTDYKLGGTTSNYRSTPSGATEARGAFSNVEPQRFFYLSGGSLNRFNTGTDTNDNTGGFPYTWSTDSIPWLHCNEDDTYCVAMDDLSANVSVMNMTTGIPQEELMSNMDEPYIAGTVNYTFSGAASPEQCWNFGTDTVSTYSNSNPTYATDPFHTHGFRDFIHHLDVASAPTTPITKIRFDTCTHTPRSAGIAQAGAVNSITLAAAETYTAASRVDLNEVCITGGTGSGQCRNVDTYNESTKVATVESNWTTTPDNTSEYEIRVYVVGYPNDVHTTMHWTDASNGGSQGGPWVIWTNNRDGAFTHDSWGTAVFLVNIETGQKVLIGHTYNVYGSGIISTYIDEGHCAVSADGVIVMCGSNLNQNAAQGGRHEVIVFELPYTRG